MTELIAHIAGLIENGTIVPADWQNPTFKEIPVLNVQTATRKTFDVQAVQVTEDNVQLVAAWCDGKVADSAEGSYIKVNVRNPQTPRHAKAFAGDWVLMTGDPKRPSYKVYLEKAFPKAFDIKGSKNRVQRGAKQLTELLTVEEPATDVPVEKRINEEAAAKVVNEGVTMSAPVIVNLPDRPSAAPSPAFLAALAASRNGQRS